MRSIFIGLLLLSGCASGGQYYADPSEVAALGDAFQDIGEAQKERGQELRNRLNPRRSKINCNVYRWGTIERLDCEETKR